VAGVAAVKRRVLPFDASRRRDFFELHCAKNGEGWCNCVAWWVPTWEGWSERSAEENRRLREALCDRGEYDGYLLYADGATIGWCQVGPRDRLEKLVRSYALEPDPETWAITCFVVAPAQRRLGMARFLLQQVLVDLRSRGVRRVEAFPRRRTAAPGELWTGPEAMFRDVGFAVARDDPERPVLELKLASASD
jgi:ribosomal protein S18 acetylase RimI-like enzyme